LLKKLKTIDLFYRRSGAGKPLVILHGLFGLSDNWAGLSKFFAEQFDTILVDLRNHGQSPHNSVFNYEVMAADVVKLSSAKTLQGSNVNITVTNGVVKVNDATVKITDIQTKNGVIHVIDKVLIPPK
jgi:hypothetical protein